MDKYIVKVNQEGITFPCNIPFGEYELVPVAETVTREECTTNRVGVDELSKTYDIYYEDGTRGCFPNKMIYRLLRNGFYALNDFEGKDIEKVVGHRRGIGFKTKVFIIAFCIKCGISVVYSEEKYGSAVQDYLKRIKKKQ